MFACVVAERARRVRAGQQRELRRFRPRRAAYPQARQLFPEVFFELELLPDTLIDAQTRAHGRGSPKDTWIEHVRQRDPGPAQRCEQRSAIERKLGRRREVSANQDVRGELLHGHREVSSTLLGKVRQGKQPWLARIRRLCGLCCLGKHGREESHA